MFLITTNGVMEQEGEARYFLLPEDIDFLATNAEARERLLESISERVIAVSTVFRYEGVPTISLEDLLETCSGIHSRF